jgi:cellulose synthase/poly-beta-1,6-N-acetylglucosamine synthase-like glycosyltransferase
MYLPFLEINLIDAVLILLVPLILDLPRVIVKCAFLLHRKIVETHGEQPSKGMPRVSIIVPAHNEGTVIDKTVESLISLVYPHKEIVVVDDNSGDDTYLKAKPYATRGEIVLVKKTDPRSNKAMALRYGLRFVSGDVIICIDADTVLQNESLIRIVEPFDDPETVAVAGNVRVYNTESLLGKIQAYEYLLAMEMGRTFQSLFQTLLIIPGAFGAFRRAIMGSIGGFEDDTMTEGFDLALKLKKTGFRIPFAPKAIAWTVVPSRFSDWSRQRIRWAYGELQSIMKHRDLLFNMNFGLRSVLSLIDMLFTDVLLLFIRLFWILSFPFLFPSIPLLEIAFLVLFFYLAMEVIQAIVAVTISPRGKKELRYLVLIPIVVLLYRPIYSIIRFFGYLKLMFGLKAGW